MPVKIKPIILVNLNAFLRGSLLDNEATKSLPPSSGKIGSKLKIRVDKLVEKNIWVNEKVDGQNNHNDEIINIIITLIKGPAIAIKSSSFVLNGALLPDRLAPYGISLIMFSLYPKLLPTKACPISWSTTVIA